MHYLRDPPNILIPILLAESQILIQAKPYIVPIEAVGRESEVQEMLLESYGDRGFTAGREASKP